MKSENILGIATIEPDRPIKAGEVGTWVIKYICGKKVIEKGGGIQLSIPRIWDPFQIDNAEGEGYTRIIVPNSVKYVVDFGYSYMTAVYQFIVVKLTEGRIKKGDEVVFIYGDNSYGSPGAKAQDAIEDEFVKYRIWWGNPTTYFHIAIDADASGKFKSLEEGHMWDPIVIPNNLDHLDVIAPSFVLNGTEINLTIVGVDRYFNRVELKKDFNVETDKSFRVLGKFFEKGTINMKVRSLEPFNVKRIKITGENGITGISNPIITNLWYGEKIYWGDIHIHSNFCDGRKNPAEIYKFCRDVSKLDFASVTSHDWGPGMDDKGWDSMKDITNSFNEDNRFVTLVGYEWTNWEKCGNRNVYYKGNDSPIFRYSYSSSKQGHENQRIDERYNTSDKLISALKNYDVISIPHHSMATMNKYFDPVIEPVIEIYSCWGSSEYRNNPDWDTEANLTGFEARRSRAVSVREILGMGFKMGFIGGSDSHSGLPGGSFNRTWANNLRKKGGLAAVYCNSLSRSNIFDSIFSRSCYATTGHRILVRFEVEGKRMGSIIKKNPENKNFPASISIEVFGTDKIIKAEVVKNNKTIFREYPESIDIKYEVLDKESFKKGDFYYLRIIQKNGEMAWSSPVFID